VLIFTPAWSHAAADRSSEWWRPCWRCKHYQIVRKKQTVNLAASNSDTIVDSAVTAYRIHIEYVEEGWQHKPLSYQHPRWMNGCKLTPPTRTHNSEQEYDLTASNRRPSTLLSRNTSQSFSRKTRSYVFSRSTKQVLTDLAYS